MHAPASVLVSVASLTLAISQPACSTPAPQPVPDSATLVTRLGRDTVALESYTRTRSRLDGRIVVRIPGTVLVHYVIDLGDNGVPTHSLVDILPSGTRAVAARRVSIDFTADSAFVDVDSMGHHRRTHVDLASGVLPQLMTGFGSSYGLYESPVMSSLYGPVAAARSGDTLHLTAFDIARGRPVRRTFIKRSPTRLDADFFGIGWNHVMLDTMGRVDSVDAMETTERTRTARAAFIDARSAARRYTAEDRAGTGLGVASPAAIEHGIVGGAPVVIAYSSPRRRDRTILGRVVPYDETWRTGANEATTLFSDTALSIGGVTIPAGTYSLWTLPKRDGGVELLINGQHGQWGTEHDPKLDIAHIPMTVAASTTPRDDFAITIAGSDAKLLRIAWDTFIWSVPITLAK